MPTGTLVSAWTFWANHQPTALNGGETLGPSTPHAPLKNRSGRMSAISSGFRAVFWYCPGKAWFSSRTMRFGDLSIRAASGASWSSRSGHSMLDCPAQTQMSPSSTLRARASPDGAVAMSSTGLVEAGRGLRRTSQAPLAEATALAESLARRTDTVSPGAAVPRRTIGWSRCSTMSSPIIGSKATAAFKAAVRASGSRRRTMRVD